MIDKKVTIVNKLGLHARAATKFVQLASRFDCDISVSLGNKKINGKSIMGVMMLAAGKGAVIEISCDGQQEKLAAQRLTRLVSDRFGEDE